MSTDVVASLLGYAPNLNPIQQIPENSSSSAVGSVGNVSGFLCGNQAKRVSFNGSCTGASVPQSAKLGLFSCGEPASFFYRCCGRYRRLYNETLEWERGGRRYVPGIGGVQSSSGSVSLERCPRFVPRLRLIPAVLSWSMLIVLVLRLAEL